MSVMLTFGSNKDMQIQIRSSQDLFIYSSSWLSKPIFFQNFDKLEHANSPAEDSRWRQLKYS